MNIVAIPGSLRNNSSTYSVLNAAAEQVFGDINFIIYEGLGSLPHFNDSKDHIPEVIAFRTLIAAADGVLICTPEYAFGVPGALKNALDWTVSSGEFTSKPVAVITAATGGTNAHSSLLLTLKALSAKVPEQCTLLISFVRAKLDERGALKDAGTIQAINALMECLIETIAATRRDQ